MKRLFYLAIIRFLRCLSFRGIRRMGNLLGWVLWTFMRRRRQETAERIMARLDVPEERAWQLARDSFNNTATSFMEIFLNDRFGLEHVRLQHTDQWNLFQTMTAHKRPVVFVTGHFGAWEILGSLVGQAVGRRVVTVARKQKDPVMSEIIRDLRAEGHLLSVDHRESVGALLSCLRGNGIACFLVDHNSSRRESSFLPFLGETAAVNIGPALLAMRAKAVVYPTFLQREGRESYSLRMEEPLDTLTLRGSLSDRLQHIVRYYTRAVEARVLDAPEQWMWMHRRWKTRPLYEQKMPQS